MEWIHQFQLFLFDLDGLLVNTESIHFAAYKTVLERRGYHLDWDFDTYCKVAHYDGTTFIEKIYETLPGLKEGPEWAVLAAEKKAEMVRVLNAGAVHLMPGVEKLLTALAAAQIPCCVCTHSSDELVTVIRDKNPILNSIGSWISRYDYVKPKPDPECYQLAITRYGEEAERIIGFEDTPRGLSALMRTRAQPVMVTQVGYPEIPRFIEKGVVHFRSFDEMNTLSINDFHEKKAVGRGCSCS